MAGIRVHRNEAARYTRMAQGASLVLLAGAVGAFALLPVAGRVEPTAVKSEGTETPVTAPAGPGIDFQATAEKLALLGDVKKDPPPTAEGHTDPEDTPGTQATSGPQWKYLGAIVEPDRLVAIVEADGLQHLMAQGSVYVGADKRKMRVLEVRDDAIVVADGAAKTTFELQPRTGAILGGAPAIGIERSEDADHENEADDGMMDPRALDRRGPAGVKRPSGPGTKNMPRTPKPNPAGPTRPRPGPPEGS